MEVGGGLRRPLSHHHLLLEGDSAARVTCRRVSSEGLLTSRLQPSEKSCSALDAPPSSFFFTGCAWGCAYHVGAYRGMIERWGLERLAGCRFGGNSAGVLVAAAAAAGMPWEFVEEIYLEPARQASEDGVLGKMTKYHAAALDRIVGEHTHEELAGRLFIGVSYIDGYEISSTWCSREELLNTIHASMHIPFYCQHIEPVGGRAGVDGGLGSPYHLIDPDTLVVDPFGVSSLLLLRLEPLFPITGRRYRQVFSDGRRRVTMLRPPPLPSLTIPTDRVTMSLSRLCVAWAGQSWAGCSQSRGRCAGPRWCTLPRGLVEAQRSLRQEL